MSVSDPLVVALALGAPAALVAVVALIRGYDITVTVTRRERPPHGPRRARRDPDEEER